MSTGNDDGQKPTDDDEPTIARPKPRLVRSINNEPTVVTSEDPQLRPSLGNRWRRMTPILAVLVLVLAMGPFISRVIDTYRAVVMDVQGGKMMIQQPMRPPRWISAIDVKPGAVVQKDPFSWNPHPVEPLAKDAPQLELAERWQSSYEGVIVEMRPPNAPGRGAVAVVQTANGDRFEVSMFAEHLATAAVGRVLHKDPGSWDPVMLPQSRGPSAGFSLTPKGDNRPPTPDDRKPAPEQPKGR